MIALDTWNLSIPVGTPAATVSTQALMSGYADTYFKSGNTLFFWAPVTGGKTANAKYARSELRETHADGSVYNWQYRDADNMLRAAVAVNQVPSTGKIVIGQIHCYGSTEPMLKLEYQYKDAKRLGNIVVKFRTTPDAEPTVITVAQLVPMNTRFTYTIHLTPAGNLTVNAFNYQWNVKVDPSWAAKSLYFKAGVYTQDDTGYATEGGAATFYKLAIDHTVKGA
ncbi:polysaccharide lyase family 7 protein [Pseudomonas typographi]|uniref:polysaccharide lyase family 7 protein n=1 Tax=Pseudomonas typographi TaxID=2715964 RepID=UPI001689EBE6|nr:polysaccharide lyase family 7 protein [Pseudomonas typographi]MBD1586432.1 polysaccharide lyase family 7 protein [Pseudomonas typographi]